jgi:hypothetical protein
LSIDVLYYVILDYVSCFVWTPGRVAADFATANGDPNKIPNTKCGCHALTIESCLFSMLVRSGCD